MQPKIVDRDAFRVLGAITPVKRKNEDPQTYVDIWQRYESLGDRIAPHSTDGTFYGIQFVADREDTIDYMTGMEIDKVVDVDAPLVVRKVPAARYAVFACPAEQIGPTYGHIFGTWLPKSGHKLRTDVPVFEQYPPAEDLKSPALIHVPLQ